MSYFNKKLFNFFSSFNILKIIMIFTLFININCAGDGEVHAPGVAKRLVVPATLAQIAYRPA